MEDGCLTIFIVILSAFAAALLTSKIYEDKPSAMDVYQGRTIMKYEIVDGEKVDSCVIFKKEEL